MRHVNDQDLDRLEGLLGGLRSIPQLRERKRGSFSRGARAFAHFHADGDDFYVDARLGARFERFRVTSDAEQATFLATCLRAVQQG